MATIRGTRNDDVLTGTPADDRIDGGAGNDTLAYSNGDYFRYTVGVTERAGADSLVITGPGTGTDQVENVEVLRFGATEVLVDGPISSQAGGGERAHGNGRGHDKDGDGFDDHANSNGRGHTHTGDDELRLSGINHDNPTAVSQTSPFSLLADGSIMNTEVRQGSISIDDGALRLETDSNNGRLRLNDFYDADHLVTLGNLDELSFDFMVQSSDRTDVIPVIRLFVDGDGNLATTSDRGELVFEWAYQGFGPVPSGWQTADLIGGDWTAWQRSNGMNWDQIVNMTEFSDWSDANGFTPVGGVHFDQNSVVLGWSVAYGSGNGTGVMYLDNLTVGATTYDFV